MLHVYCGLGDILGQLHLPDGTQYQELHFKLERKASAGGALLFCECVYVCVCERRCFFIIYYTTHSSSGLLALLMNYLKSYLTNAMIPWSHITQ